MDLQRTPNGVVVDNNKSFVRAGKGDGEWVMEQEFKYVGQGRGQFTPLPEPASSAGVAVPAQFGQLGQLCYPVWFGASCLALSVVMVWLLIPESSSRWRPSFAHSQANSLSEVRTYDGEEDVASLVEASLKNRVAGPYEEFEAVLDHTSGERFGFRLTSEYNSLYLDHIDESQGCLVAAWNTAHPSRRLQAGDRIIEVNGVHGSAMKLLEECNRLRPLKLKVLRVEDGPMKEVVATDFYEVILDRTKGASFGADIMAGHTSLLIKNIHGGLFGKWNKANPDSVVQPGDRIISVNLVEGSASKLLAACNWLHVLEVRLIRGPGRYRRPVHEVPITAAPWGASWAEPLGDVSLLRPAHPSPGHEEAGANPGYNSEAGRTVSEEGTTHAAVVQASATSTTSISTSLSTTAITTSPTKSVTLTNSSTLTSTTRSTTSSSTSRTAEGQIEYVRGLKAEFFYHIDKEPGMDLLPVTMSKIDRVCSKTPDLVRLDPQVYYPLTLYGWPGIGVKDYFVGRWTGQLVIKKGGTYYFQLKSDDGSAMMLDGKRLHGGEMPFFDEHPWQAEPSHRKQLERGGHDLVVLYFNTVLHAGIIAMYQGPDTNDELVAIPAYALRSHTSALPPELLEDAIFIRRFDGDDAWTGRLHLSSGFIALVVHVLFVGLFLSAVLVGAVVAGKKVWSKQRESGRQSHLWMLVAEDRRSLRRWSG